MDRSVKRIYISGHNSFGIKHSDKTRKKISLNNKGKNLGRHHIEDYKLKLSYKMKKEKINLGMNNPMYGIKSPTKGKSGLKGNLNGMYGKPCARGTGKTKWYFINNMWVQGIYEKRFIETCLKYGISCVKKSEILIPYFNGSANRTYRPDFEIRGIDGVIEIKGFLSFQNIIKLNACYQKASIYMIWKDQLERFENTGDINILKERLIIKDFPLMKEGLNLEKIKRMEKENE